jgi:hypothetical protein
MITLIVMVFDGSEKYERTPVFATEPKRTRRIPQRHFLSFVVKV